MTETWFRIERFNETQDVVIEVDVPDSPTFTIPREVFIRLLCEAGYRYSPARTHRGV